MTPTQIAAILAVALTLLALVAALVLWLCRDDAEADRQAQAEAENKRLNDGLSTDHEDRWRLAELGPFCSTPGARRAKQQGGQAQGAVSRTQAKPKPLLSRV